MIYIKLILTAVFWGGTFIAGRFIAPFVGPFSGSFLRFVFASTLLIMIICLHEGGLPRLNPRQAFLAVLLGLTGVFAYNVLFLAGLKSVTAGRASVIIANNPVFLALFSSLIFKEHLNLKKITGIAMSLTGAVIAITRGDFSMIWHGAIGIGELMIFGCVASWVSYSLFGKKLMSGISPLAAVTYSSLFGAGFLLFPACMEGISRSFMHYGFMTWMGILYLALFGTVIGFTWFYEGVNTIGPTRSGVFINFVPISAIILAFFLLGEEIDFSLVVGITLVTTGVLLTNRPESLITADPRT
ncbi:MAG TPA: DMT family transporter [Deltaproteobacteria bacterium]|nr:DMT family transporter [Deltaproteobacteria bacterium]